jgi:hypothetical protein
MDDKTIQKPPFFETQFFAFIVGIVLGGLLFGITAHTANTEEWQRATVKRGYAEYYIKDEYGRSSWRWIEKDK